MNRAVFLDRDNTLIHNDGDLGDPALVKLIQGAASAVASLRGLGYAIIVVTNQGGVARGKYTEADVQAVNTRINDEIRRISGASVDRFYYCPYHPDATVEKYRSEHPWRKPQPGMLLQAARDLELDMSQSWTIGDQMRDIEAGAAAGTRTILLTPEAGVAQPPLLQDKMAAELLGKAPVLPDFVARNIIEAVRIVAQQRRPDGVEGHAALEPATARGANVPVAMSSATARLASAAHASHVTPPARITPPPASTPRTPPKPTSDAEPPAVKLTHDARPSSDAEPPGLSKVEGFRAGSATSPAAPKPAEPTIVVTPKLVVPPAASPTLPPVVVHPSTPEPVLASMTPGPLGPDAPIPNAPEKSLVSAEPMPAPAIPTTSKTPGPLGPDAPPAAASTVPVFPPAQVHERPVVTSPGMEQTLRQILQELRNQRPVSGELNYVGLMAVVLQFVAVLCFLAGLFMGNGHDALFLRWLGVALVIQLISVAMMLYKR